MVNEIALKWAEFGQLMFYMSFMAAFVIWNQREMNTLRKKRAFYEDKYRETKAVYTILQRICAWAQQGEPRGEDEEQWLLDRREADSWLRDEL